MNKKFHLALFVLLILAPQTSLFADGGWRFFQHRSFKPLKVKLFNSIHVRFATREELEELSQAIDQIVPQVEALEAKFGGLPDNLVEKLAELQAGVDSNAAATAGNAGAISDNAGKIVDNASDISLALSDIMGILTDIETLIKNAEADRKLLTALESTVVELGARLDGLDSKIDDHEARLAELEQPGSSESVTFSGDFIAGEEASTQIQLDWTAFRSEATGEFASIEIKNSLGGSEICSDPASATEIASALNTHTPGSLVSVFCNDQWWNVGTSGSTGVELNAGPAQVLNNCTQQVAAVRPQIGNPSWGGIGLNNICNAPSQTLEVVLAR